MRLHSQRGGSGIRRAVLLAAVVVSGAMILPANAAPQDSVGIADADELPPGGGYQTSGIVKSTQGLVARGSKMYITIEPENPIVGSLRYGRFNEPIQDPIRYEQRNTVAWPFEAPECSTVPADELPPVQYVLSDLTTLSATPDGVLDEVGALPETRVNLLAFGSVPASATINMRMTRTNGEVAPWAVHVWNPGRGNAFPGCTDSARFYRALVEGQVDVTLRDLEVDGRPVELGSQCRTERPVDLQLWGEEGYQALQTGNLGQFDGLATGTRIPLESPYYFENDGRGLIPDSSGVDIPPFIGCGVGGEDLSPLVTAMASGPNNPMRVSQGQPMYSGVDPEDIDKCDGPGFCPEPPESAPPMPPLPEEDAP